MPYAVLLFAALIGASALYIRFISSGFANVWTTVDHPYTQFVAALMFAGLCWIALVPIFKRMPLPGRWFWGLIILGIGLRLIFLGSTPIYEIDWHRYLWDGAVTLSGQNPYEYAPAVTFEVAMDAPQAIHDLQDLALHNDVDTHDINYPHLTTIYPPIAMGVFSIPSIISPFDLDVLRLIYLLIDLAALRLLVVGLKMYGRDAKWALLYWLNPMLIYSVYNAAHMDIILIPFLIAALILAKRHAFGSAVMIGMAAAVKFWPLLLAPILLRGYRKRLPVYISAGALSGLVFIALTFPMLLSLGENSGLVAYAGTWEKSSFLFPLLKSLMGFVSADPGFAARIGVALILTGLSMWLALKPKINIDSLPLALLCVTSALFFLSPAGYPWYTIWFLPFLAFTPLYGAATLTITTALYYSRYALGEMGRGDVYTDYLLPIQFAVPLIIILFEIAQNIRKTAA